MNITVFYLLGNPSYAKASEGRLGVPHLSNTKTKSPTRKVRLFVWLGSWDSNPGPIGYTCPNISTRGGLYLCRDPPKANVRHSGI